MDSNSIQTRNAMPITREFIEHHIFPLVQALNGLGGVRTFASCQGHWQDGLVTRPYVAFEANVCRVVALRKALFKSSSSSLIHYPWRLRSFERPNLGLGYVLEIPVEWWAQKNSGWWKFLPFTSQLDFKRWNTHQKWVIEDLKTITESVLQISISSEQSNQEMPWMMKNLKDPSLCIKVWSPSPQDLCWRALCDMLNIDPLTLQIESQLEPDEAYRIIAFRGLPENSQELVLAWVKANFKESLVELN